MKYLLARKMDRWIKLSILLIIVGVILVAINQIFYVPRFLAFSHALSNWSKNETSTAQPSLETFGLNVTSMIIYSALGWLGSLLIFAGALYLVILLIAKILRRLNPKT
jgi:hypothetical protein